MADLMLDATGDLALSAGNGLQIVTGSAAIAQRIRLVITTFKGEWFLDENHGTDWRGRVLGKTSETERNAYLREAIRGIRGVTGIESLSSTFDGATRHLTVSARVQISTGSIVPIEVVV